MTYRRKLCMKCDCFIVIINPGFLSLEHYFRVFFFHCLQSWFCIWDLASLALVQPLPVELLCIFLLSYFLRSFLHTNQRLVLKNIFLKGIKKQIKCVEYAKRTEKPPLIRNVYKINRT